MMIRKEIRLFHPPVWALLIQIGFNALFFMEIIPPFFSIVTILGLFISSECYGVEQEAFQSKPFKIFYWTLFTFTILTLIISN